MHLQWPALSDDKIQAGEGTIGLVMEYGIRRSPVQHFSGFPYHRDPI